MIYYKGYIWTIGHSTHTLDEFIAMLRSFQIELVVDIRSFPGSRRYPHFNKEALEISLPENKIEYIHLKGLGGRRKVHPNSVNKGWRSLAFRGYADYIWNPIRFIQRWKSLSDLRIKIGLPICARKQSGGVATDLLFLTILNFVAGKLCILWE